jgi:hypothetical protein
MKILRQLNHSKYRHLGISKKGKLHASYWDDAKEEIVWKSIDGMGKQKTEVLNS